MIYLKTFVLSTLLLCSANLYAADYYVNNRIGSDNLDGTSIKVSGHSGPMLTINKALKLLKAGDTLHLANTGKVYRQSINIPPQLSGTAERKITINGHGAWLTCAEPIPAERWEPAKQGPAGTLRLAELKGRYDFGISLLLDGDKVKKFGDREALKPGQFWYYPTWKTLYYSIPDSFKGSTITITQTDGKTVEAPPGKWGDTNFRHIAGLRRFRGLTSPPKSITVNGKAAALLETPGLDNLAEGRMSCVRGRELYYRPLSGKKISDLQLMGVFRSSGIGISGANKHLIIKNFNVAYTTNDGYNIHGATRDILFQNCNAFFCGDEGYSSHGKCETTLDGGIFLNCSNGIHNVNNSSTTIRNVIVGGVSTGGVKIDSSTSNNSIENTILIDCPLIVSNTKTHNILTLNSKDLKRGTHPGMNLGPNVHINKATVTGKGRIRLNAKSKGSFEHTLFAFSGRGMHVRADLLDGIISFKDCFYDPDFTMEWGTGHPFKRSSFTKWVQDNPTLASHCQTNKLDLNKALNDGHIPEGLLAGMGCSKELLQRAIDFLPKRQALLKQAKRIVLGE